jgi:hypothetical protein
VYHRCWSATRELVASFPSGKSFSHGPRREATAPYASSTVRKMWGTPWESGASMRVRAACVTHALLLPSGRMEPCSPTTSRGEVEVHNAQPVRGKRPPLVRAAQSRRVSTRTGICRLVLC